MRRRSSLCFHFQLCILCKHWLRFLPGTIERTILPPISWVRPSIGRPRANSSTTKMSTAATIHPYRQRTVTTPRKRRSTQSQVHFRRLQRRSLPATHRTTFRRIVRGGSRRWRTLCSRVDQSLSSRINSISSSSSKSFRRALLDSRNTSTRCRSLPFQRRRRSSRPLTAPATAQESSSMINQMPTSERGARICAYMYIAHRTALKVQGASRVLTQSVGWRGRFCCPAPDSLKKHLCAKPGRCAVKNSGNGSKLLLLCIIKTICTAGAFN